VDGSTKGGQQVIYHRGWKHYRKRWWQGVDWQAISALVVMLSAFVEWGR
jgi:ABC-type antimicrobial peptide transport system ATPase subunit